ncbi:MAG: apolipoprotein N-acyltransferase [Acidobacteria bacterium]|nr:MAG: apolipoprotein N-acyltransferase [Acidobacteriota bacterium]
MASRLKFVLLPLFMGAMINLAFKPAGLWFLVFPAMAVFPFFRYRNPQQRLLFGWLTGFFIQAFGYTWIFTTIRDFGGLSSLVSAAGAFLFWAYQGFDFALWFLLAPLLFKKNREQKGCPSDQGLYLLGDAGLFFLIQCHFYPYVFPWNLSAALTESPFLTTASLCSSHGLVFFITLTGLTLGEMARRKRAHQPVQTGPFAFLALSVAILSLGSFLYQPQSAVKHLKVGVVQPNIIPWAKRDRGSFKEIFDKHIQMTLTLNEKKPDLILWSETSMNFILANNQAYVDYFQELADTMGTGLMLGALGKDSKGYTNEIWLFTPQKEPQVYAKEKLVMFSESLPWPFFWAEYLVPGIGNFHSGEKNAVFSFKDLKINPLVCFEAILPHYTAKRDAQLLVNLTNDAWFGPSKASSLHLQHLQMRTVENGLPLVRAANSGISCWIDTKGKIQGPTAVYEASAVIYDIPIPLKGSPRVWPWMEGFLTFLTVCLAFFLKTKKK